MPLKPGILVKQIAKGPLPQGNTTAMTLRCRASSLHWSFELQGCIKGHATAAVSDMEGFSSTQVLLGTDRPLFLEARTYRVQAHEVLTACYLPP